MGRRSYAITVEDRLPDCGYLYVADTRMGFSPVPGRPEVLRLWPTTGRYVFPNITQAERLAVFLGRRTGREVVIEGMS
jgi:hypothetical protein